MKPNSRAILVTRIVALLVVAIIVGCGKPEAELTRLLPPGAPLPELDAEGWINEPALSAQDLDGQVVVIDVWASWCRPCRQTVPEVIEAYDKYHERGVLFLGLTMEGSARLEDSRAFVKNLNIPWPNGFGAEKMIAALGVEKIPALFVVGRNGRIVWNSDRRGTLHQAIESALERG